MGYLVAIAGSLILLAGFLALTRYEAARGVRFFAARRGRFDAEVERLEFIFTHVDLAAFLREEVERVSARVGHDVAHLVLQAIRAVERVLTRVVRRLRTHEDGAVRPTREASREFVRKLTDFKTELSAAKAETDIS